MIIVSTQDAALTLRQIREALSPKENQYTGRNCEDCEYSTDGR